MSVRTYVKSVLLCALVALSVGGFLLHSRIHPVAQHSVNLIPWISGILGILLVPLLFSFRKTIAIGYVLNGFSVIIGTIVMTHFSIVHFSVPVTWKSIFLNTLLGDIFLLWGKFFVGKALFDLETFGYAADIPKKGKPFRYPTLGWWLVHLVLVTFVYVLGNRFWR